MAQVESKLAQRSQDQDNENDLMNKSYEMYGKANIDIVYSILRKHKDNRFEKECQKVISQEVSSVLSPQGVSEIQQAEMIGYVSSVIII